MEIKKIKKFVTISAMVVLCGSMTACRTCGLKDGESKVGESITAGNWIEADSIIEKTQCDQDPHTQGEVDNWRSKELIRMRSAFAKTLMPKVEEANALYSKGNLSDGDKVRQSLRDQYFGASGNVEAETSMKQLFSSGKKGSSGIPESLVPCLDLAWVQMLSDRNLSRMTMAFNGYLDQIKAIDVNGGKKSIKQLDAIAVGFEKVDKWKDKIDLFMNMLADNETRRWAPVDRSQYAISIKKMSSVRDEVRRQYKTKRWNTRVADRKSDYRKIEELSAAKKYHAAMQILSSHDLLIKPEGLKDVVEFDDQAERAQVASGALGEEMVKLVFQAGLSGVQYNRRDAKRGMLSMLIVGRTFVDNKADRRKLREAGRVAQMQARSEFVKYMSTSVSAESEIDSIEKDDQVQERSHVNMKEKAQAEVSNLVVLATGVDGNDVVFILGWRDPDLGMITPVPMHRVAGEENFTVSPSVGAYL